VWIRCGPLPPGFLEPGKHLSTILLDRRGTVIYESLSSEEGRSRWIAASTLPENLVRATLAAEDHRFFSHSGIDWIAVARAAAHDCFRGRLAEGGSTLTQQVVKQLLHRRSGVMEKIREAVVALRLDHRLSKKEILALYLNLAPYGHQYAGAESAALGYFGCPAANLTTAQAAFLAGLPQRPAAFDPYRSFSRAASRKIWVLDRMKKLGLVTPGQAAVARSERLVLRRDAKSFAAPHFSTRVLAELSPGVSGVVATTLDAALQQELAGIVAAHRSDLDAHGAHDVAAAVLDNRSGEWLAWEGSGCYFDAEHGGSIDGVSAPRQPGSALKPFTYALAFEAGFTPASVLPDLPSTFPTAEAGVLYSPRNYDGVFRGPLTARAALAGSENVPAVWLISRIGVPPLLEWLRRAGFSTLSRNAPYYGYALTMGDAEVRLDELIAAYAAIARGGIAVSPRFIPGAETASGRRILSEKSAFWVTDILSDARARSYVFGSGGSLDFPFPVAVKTGTSQAYRDNWTIGYTREVTVGVWVGNFDRTEMKGSSGVAGAGPIFHDLMFAAERRALGRFPNLADTPLASPPSELRAASICALSGLPASADCPRVENEWLPAAAPGRLSRCDWHLREGARIETRYPPAYRVWARDRGLASARLARNRAESEKLLSIVSPPSGATYRIDPTLRGSYQQLALRALSNGPARKLAWSVDSKRWEEAWSDIEVSWPLTPGDHRIRVTDGRENSDEVLIFVR
jgi:penicillin-binding protein 1C